MGSDVRFVCRLLLCALVTARSWSMLCSCVGLCQVLGEPEKRSSIRVKLGPGVGPYFLLFSGSRFPANPF